MSYNQVFMNRIYKILSSHMLMTEYKCPLLKGWMYPLNMKDQAIIPYSKALL